MRHRRNAGYREDPGSLREQVFWEAVAHGGAGLQSELEEGLVKWRGPTREPFLSMWADGWRKFQAVHRLRDGRNMTIHFWMHPGTGERNNLKLVSPPVRNPEVGLRELERRAATGDPDAIRAWLAGMERAGKLSEVPALYSQFMTNDQLAAVFAANPALALGGLDHWIARAGDTAFSLHDAWAGEGSFGPSGHPARRFVQWARTWICMIFLREVSTARTPEESEQEAHDHEIPMLAGVHMLPVLGEPGHRAMGPLGNNEIMPLVEAMYG